jgi:Xaa-Pro aminopeptidase
MTFSIEPGAYFPGRFGVRLEDVAIVGERGGESMTHSPRDLRIVR